MKRKLSLLFAAVLLSGLVLTACASPSGEDGNTEFETGEAVSTYWFDFTVNSAETAKRYGAYTAAEGSRLVVCELTIENTFKTAIPMGWADFVLLWTRPDGGSSDETQGVYPIPAGYADRQFPEEYEIEKGDTAEGILIFEVPEDVTQAAILFQELYADGESESQYTEGASFLVRLTL